VGDIKSGVGLAEVIRPRDTTAGGSLSLFGSKGVEGTWNTLFHRG